MSSEVLAEVAPFTPVRGTFTYGVPEELAERVRPGVRVLVPFGARPVTGVVLSLPQERPEGVTKVRPIQDVLDPAPVLPEAMLGLLRWAADYYMTAPGELIRAALPAGMHGKAARVAHRTPAGSAALEAGTLDAAREALLSHMSAEAPGTPCAPLLKLVGEGARMRHLVDLAARGLAVLDYRLQKPGVRVRTETVHRHLSNPEADAAPLTPKRSTVLEVLREAGEVGITTAGVAETVPSPGAQIRWLVAQGLAATSSREVVRDPFAGQGIRPDKAPTWTDEQSEALKVIGGALEAGTYRAILLHGVTGSGKTEVYLEAIRQVTEAGRQALVLVPEISLTPQLAGRFRARFGDRVAVLHSGLSAGERYDQWRRIRAGDLPIAVGARSAIFAPFERLGIVVVDEEHDSSYKQEEQPRYHARDLALVRAQRAGIPAILGSATPSLESHVNAQRGKLTKLRLVERPTGGTLPTVELVDMRRAGGRRDNPLTPRLSALLEETVGAGEQAILFLNRRGWSSFVVCRACGRTFECKHCSVGLTHHRRAGRLRCHYCDYREAVPDTCPDCGDPDVGLLGVGTERLESAVRDLLPEARVARLDRDTVGHRSMTSLVDAMRSGELDVLVGTQMVTKGHDFPGVTLVGVIAADLGLSQPDFRASERTFQLLTQVAGRAGRGDRPGRVIIQTFSPGHYALVTAREHDHDGFAERELAVREELGYPPYGHMVAFKLDSEDEPRVRRAADAVYRAMVSALRRPGAGRVTILGPAPAALALLRGRHRWHILLKSARRGGVRSLALAALDTVPPRELGGVRLAVDVDPIQLL